MTYLLKTIILSCTFLISFSLEGQDFIPHHKCGKLVVEDEHLRQTNWGYSYNDLLIDLETWKLNSFVSIQSIGKSVQTRDLWQLKITNNDIPDEGKRIVSIHARTHPNEVQAWWVTNAMINQLLSENTSIQNLLDQCVFYIIPMYNPDGVELEYPRENAHGIDIESNWNVQSVEPEVAALRTWFLSQMNSDNPIEIALNMHSAIACKRYFVYHDEGGTNFAYTEIEKKFIEDVGSYYTDGFQDWNYYVSWKNSTPTYYPESWFWLNYGQNVLALTYEDMNCETAGNYDQTAFSILNGIADQFGINYTSTFEVDKDLSSIIVYPNPVYEVLSVELSDQSTISSYTLFDSHGKIILNEKHDILNFFRIDFNYYEAGIYVLQVNTQSQVHRQKVLLIK